MLWLSGVLVCLLGMASWHWLGNSGALQRRAPFCSGAIPAYSCRIRQARTHWSPQLPPSSESGEGAYRTPGPQSNTTQRRRSSPRRSAWFCQTGPSTCSGRRGQLTPPRQRGGARTPKLMPMNLRIKQINDWRIDGRICWCRRAPWSSETLTMSTRTGRTQWWQCVLFTSFIVVSYFTIGRSFDGLYIFSTAVVLVYPVLLTNGCGLFLFVSVWTAVVVSMLWSGHRLLRVVVEVPRILQLWTNVSEWGSSVENCHFGKSFFFFFSF